MNTYVTKRAAVAQPILLTAFLVFAVTLNATAEEEMSSDLKSERELISFDLELDELGISNTKSNAVSRSNPQGMTPAIAKQMLDAQQEEIKNEIRQQFCDQPPTDMPCKVLPNDNTDFSELFVYIFLTQAAQNSFDVFSWQSFIALNWPEGGTDESTNLNDSQNHLPRVWSTFKTPQQVFKPDYQDMICADAAAKATRPVLTTSNYIQPSGRPLIDRNLNYLVYDVRVNDEMANYVRGNSLYTLQGQKDYQASGSSIDFPVGFYADPTTKTGGTPGSIAIKSAWKILDTDNGDDPSRYFTIAGLIPVTAEQSESGKPVCIEAELALVGMHIMRRTDSGHGRNWIWSTFEHIDNAPLAENARRPNDIFNDILFDGGCKPPRELNRRFSLFSEQCPDCPTNELPKATWKWASSRPYARSFAKKSGVGSQVVRCWDIFSGTQLINEVWQQKLEGTVWSNYQSISAQWKGANRGKTVPEGEVPRFMTNTTMETYEQYSHTGSCLSCHAAARSVAGQKTEFSFLLSLQPRYQ